MRDTAVSRVESGLTILANLAGLLITAEKENAIVGPGGNAKGDKQIYTALSAERKDSQPGLPTGEIEVSKVRIVASIKGEAPAPVGQTVEFLPFGGEDFNPPFEVAEHLEPGKRYIILPTVDGRNHAELYEGNRIGAKRCGVQPDTPEVRRELAKGFEMNDDLHESRIP